MIRVFYVNPRRPDFIFALSDDTSNEKMLNTVEWYPDNIYFFVTISTDI